MGRVRRTTAGDRAVMVDGDIVGSVIVTGDNVSVELNVGPENGALLEQVGLRQRPRVRKQRPARPPGRRMDHLDREGEATRALALLAGGPVNVHGEPGIGKTYLLRDLAGRTPAAAAATASRSSTPARSPGRSCSRSSSTPSSTRRRRRSHRRRRSSARSGGGSPRPSSTRWSSSGTTRRRSSRCFRASRSSRPRACACSGTARRCVSKG